MRRIIAALLAFLRCMAFKPRSTLQFVVQVGDIIYKAKQMDITVKRDNAPLNFAVVYKDKDGIVEKPLSPVVWAATGPMTLVPADDGMSAVGTITASGVAIVTATADSVTATSTVTIEALPIISGEITVS